ncbi:mitochondrial inner-membrane-bound regulator-domain-containing protein [Massariosphaeria phaeospora]|uniref:Mitochondrial inner-membrane-bound regulator-domain-containing protein n=1 Tax=Massariosphaeria phaeospora TaxID=100035 RepID=A0A7C8IBM9_9PLEO|nr:mitochondrial inner-membrane-bound regulator-domain-containing protein [Massariosphaeria phaeospora]
MLAPRASSAFVCIRCELGLARRRVPIRSPIAPAHANFSASTRRRDAHDEAAAVLPRPRSQITLPGAYGKIRRRKGKAPLMERTARLGGVKQLGDDAEILVLTEMGDAPEEESTPPEPEVENQEAPDFLASLESENTPLSLEDGKAQIEGLRPKPQGDATEPHYITQATFIKLSKALIKGFTSPQLSHYYLDVTGLQSSKMKSQIMGDALVHQRSAAKQSIERTQWHPGTTPLKRRLPGLDVKRTPKSSRNLSKPLLADQILRNVWKLELLEEIEAPGELEMTFRSWQLSLLNSGGSPTPLDRIGLERKAKLEIHWEHSVLRITADKSTAEYAADDVEQLLQRTESKRFTLSDWTPLLAEHPSPRPLNALKSGLAFTVSDIWDTKSLETVTQLSRAAVYVATQDRLIIRGLDKAALEEAERCLVKMLPLKQPYPRSIDQQRLDVAKDRGILLPTAFQSTLDYRARLLNLGRWTLPMQKTVDVEAVPEDESAASVSGVQETIAALVQEAAAIRANVADKNKGSQLPQGGYWDKHSVLNISADFGHALFPITSTNSALPPFTSDATQLSVQDVRFGHVFPGLSKLLIDDVFLIDQKNVRTPKLEYEYMPAPYPVLNGRDGYPEDYPAYPSVRLRVRSPINKEPVLEEVRLSFNQRSHLVLLPDQAADVHFRISETVRMGNPDQNTTIKELFEVIAANIASGDRLTAPPSLTLEVPKWILDPKKPGGWRKLEYLFTGITFRQTAVGAFGQHDLSYSTVQAGKLGKRGSSLSMHHTLKGPVGAKRLSEAKKYVGRSFEVADWITRAAANTKPMAKALRPRHDNSPRQLRRQSHDRTTASAATVGDGAAGNPFEHHPALNVEEGTLEDRRSITIEEGDIEDPHLSSILSPDSSADGPAAVEAEPQDAFSNVFPDDSFSPKHKIKSSRSKKLSKKSPKE